MVKKEGRRWRGTVTGCLPAAPHPKRLPFFLANTCNSWLAGTLAAGFYQALCCGDILRAKWRARITAIMTAAAWRQDRMTTCRRRLVSVYHHLPIYSLKTICMWCISYLLLLRALCICILGVADGCVLSQIFNQSGSLIAIGHETSRAAQRTAQRARAHKQRRHAFSLFIYTRQHAVAARWTAGWTDSLSAFLLQPSIVCCCKQSIRSCPCLVLGFHHTPFFPCQALLPSSQLLHVTVTEQA